MQAGRNAFKSNFTDTKIDPFTIGNISLWVMGRYGDFVRNDKLPCKLKVNEYRILVDLFIYFLKRLVDLVLDFLYNP